MNLELLKCITSPLYITPPKYEIFTTILIKNNFLPYNAKTKKSIF